PLPAPGLLLRAVHPPRPGTHGPQPLRDVHVGAGLRERRRHRRARLVPRHGCPAQGPGLGVDPDDDRRAGRLGHPRHRLPGARAHRPAAGHGAALPAGVGHPGQRARLRVADGAVGPRGGLGRAARRPRQLPGAYGGTATSRLRRAGGRRPARRARRLVTVSLDTALFPRLSHSVHDRALDAVPADLRRGMTMPAVLLIPATAVIILLAPLVLAATLPGTSRAATDASVGVLVTMILGLVPYGWFFLIQRAYYAYEDGRTPFALQLVVTLVAVGVTLFGSTQPAEHVATWVGIGQSLSNLTAATIGIWLLRRRLGTLGLGLVVRQNVRLIVATAIATAVGWAALQLLSG